jgi:hypothetical protein
MQVKTNIRVGFGSTLVPTVTSTTATTLNLGGDTTTGKNPNGIPFFITPHRAILFPFPV